MRQIAQADITRTLQLFKADSAVAEIRVLNVKQGRTRPFTMSGYFDNVAAATTTVAMQDAEFHQSGIYITLNECDATLLARSPNKLTEYLAPTTSDREITRRLWFLIDVDPKRPAGIGSNEAQVGAARDRAEEIREWLASHGWHEPVEAMSGNGWHLLYPIDLPNDEPATTLLRDVLKGIAVRFSNDDLEVDEKVFNASRITKLYGTLTRKGGETADRPHRRSRLEYVPDYLENGHAEPMPVERLQAVAETLEQTESKPEIQNNAGNLAEYVSRSPYGAIDRCKRYLAKLPDAASGNNGHGVTLQAACECFKFGLSDADAMSVMQWFNDTKTAGEPWSDKELRHKLNDGRKKVDAAREFGSRNRSNHNENGDAPQAAKTTKPKITFERITSPELDSNDYAMEYLIDGVLVAGQPMVIAGPQKSLKTSLLIDLAVSLSTCGHFLGYFPVSRSARTCVMSGESGMATIQETARRIAAVAGKSLSDLDIIWSPDLPRFDDADHHAALKKFLLADSIEVLVIDPAYLTMPSDNTGNIFSQGELLRNMAEVCKSAGVQMLLAHHTKKNRVSDRFEPVELEDISWSGFQEFARQWILIGRRKTYEPGTGSHRLWLSVGGSAGHGGLWGLDIEEGKFKPSEPRTWDVSLSTASGVKKASEEDKSRKKAKRLEETENANRRKLLDALKLFPDGETQTTLQSTAGLNSASYARAAQTLIKEGRLAQCQITKGNKRNYDAWKLTEPGKVVATRLGNSQPDSETMVL